ncbi:FadR/GntR family transcriptional regulator [Herbaspirillum lusitanum]|jgi:DNA-binding FadR family transcriptional regulator|uniref:FadR/GntR family transcriptional regulator n=1 Tax=Herbaspirillum lusitanum TaxID=213312 RepID=A0ABW9AED9_9BURK
MDLSLQNKLAAVRQAARHDQRRADIVIEFVRSAVSDGTLKPGDRLPTELEIAEALGVSRTPVREAMRVLETLGVLDISPGSGTYLKSGVGNSLSLLFMFQSLLQDPSAELLAELRTIFERACAEIAGVKATDEDLAAMRDAIARLEALHALPEPDIELIVDADLDFHRAVYAATHNPLISTLADYVLSMLRPWIHATQIKEGPEKSILLHQAEYESITRSLAQPTDPSEVRKIADLNMAHWLSVLSQVPNSPTAHTRLNANETNGAAGKPERGK